MTSTSTSQRLEAAARAKRRLTEKLGDAVIGMLAVVAAFAMVAAVTFGLA
jgi:hypothetical protein